MANMMVDVSSNKPSGSFVLLQQTHGGKPSVTGTFKQHGGEITSCLDTHEPPGFSKQMVEVEEEEAEQLQQCRQRVEEMTEDVATQKFVLS